MFSVLSLSIVFSARIFIIAILTIKKCELHQRNINKTNNQSVEVAENCFEKQLFSKSLINYQKTHLLPTFRLSMTQLKKMLLHRYFLGYLYKSHSAEDLQTAICIKKISQTKMLQSHPPTLKVIFSMPTIFSKHSSNACSNQSSYNILLFA